MEKKRKKETEINICKDKRYILSTPNKNAEVIVLKFSGHCGIGSRGNEDTTYMYRVVVGEIPDIRNVQPRNIIVDCSDLHYSWGNGIADLIYLNDVPELNVIFVIGDFCRKGFKSLFAAFCPVKDSLIHDNLENAVLEIEKHV
ncbi:hypothetical protein [Candidatus Uabimicrobium sp. HlEnr_7]|uniref:hypothetical protein n=1 Tax=Candidatus Uabimicrobium helgolandensis TaxID=3095367 RepID=UPI00355603F7